MTRSPSPCCSTSAKVKRSCSPPFVKTSPRGLPGRCGPRITSPSSPSTATSFRPQAMSPPTPPRCKRAGGGGGGFDRALTSPLTRSQPRQPPCGKSIPFRGSLVFAMKKLGELPGRRILLVVSAGSDGKSSITWPQLSDQAGIDSVTVFTLASPRSLEFQELKDLLAFSQKSGGLIFTPRLSELPRHPGTNHQPAPPALHPAVPHAKRPSPGRVSRRRQRSKIRCPHSSFDHQRPTP